MSVRFLRPLPVAYSSILALALTFFFAIPAFSQGTNATLSGVVTDPSAAVVPGAELTLTNQASAFELKSNSNDRGEYTFRNLVPGTYDLKVTKTGFTTHVQRNIVLTINQAGHADATLTVGAQTETVSVSADSTLLNFDNGTVQGGVDPRTLNELPLVVEGKPRSSANLALLLPGVSTGSGNQAFRARINGGLESGDEALMDGATMQQGFMSQSGMVTIHQDFQMSPDMVQEVKIIASNYDAQFGGSTSGQIAVVTKSGGTSYHANAFEYGRNKALNAKPWNARPCPATKPGCDQRPADNEHDFGANVGGPIKIPKIYEGTSKHKSFFYFNWESFHQAGGSSVPTLSIPSIKERAGDFTDWVDAQGNLIPIYVPKGVSAGCQAALGAVGPGQQFPGNRIPQPCFSPIATAYMALLPTPTNGLPTSNYTLSKPVPDTLTSNSNVYMFRIDHNYGESDKFYFTYWRQFVAQNLSSQLPAAISSDRTTNLQNSPIYRFNWEHVFSPKMTNHVTWGYLNRNEGDTVLNLDQLGKLPAVMGVAAANTLPAFTFGDGFQQLSNTAASKTTRPTWVLNDVATRVFGAHTITFGAEWRNVQGNINNRANGAGTFNFTRATTSTPNVTSGSPVAGFLLGAVSTGVVDFRTITSWHPRQKVYVLHVNDSWRITPKFTLNYGLRWDYYTPSREKEDHYSFIDPLGTNPDAGNLPGRLAFAGSGYGPASFGRDYPEEPWHNGFAPRLGIAYSWDQKTVVRAGYGIFYTQAFYPGWGGGMALEGFNLKDTENLRGSLGTDPAFFLDQGFPSVSARLGCTLGASCIKPGFDNGRTPTAANGNGSAYRTIDGNRRPYSQQWNLTIERELPQNIALSVAYVGSKGTRLPSSLQPINVLNPFAANVRGLETTRADGSVPLRDTFATTDTSKNGVPIPYAGWVQQMNAGGCNATVAQALLPFPQFCGQLLGLNENHGNSIYHSFQLKAEKRFSRGLYMLASYTASKLISDASDNTQQAGGTWNATQGVISPFEKRRARSISSDDVPRVLSAAFVYELPFGAGKPFLNQGGGLNAVVGGWQISPIIRYSSGTPMWFRSSTCQVVAQLRQACLVGLIPGKNPFLQDPNHFDPRQGPLLDATAFEPLSNFQVPANSTGVGGPGQFGYVGSGPRVTNLRGPNFKDFDFSLTKNTKLTERTNFQLRFSFFNAFNNHYFIDNGVNNQGSSFAFKNDIASAGANGFGTWNRNISPPRTIQIGARLEF